MVAPGATATAGSRPVARDVGGRPEQQPLPRRPAWVALGVGDDGAKAASFNVVLFPWGGGAPSGFAQWAAAAAKLPERQRPAFCAFASHSMALAASLS